MTSGGDNFSDFPMNQLTKFLADKTVIRQITIRHQKKNYLPPNFFQKHPASAGVDVPGESLTMCLFRVAYAYAPLCANMTSSIKPEVKQGKGSPYLVTQLRVPEQIPGFGV